MHGHISVLRLQGIQIQSPFFENITAVLLLLMLLVLVVVVVVSASE